MEQLVKKYFWVLNLVALMIAGFMVASTVNEYVAEKVLVIPGTSLTISDQTVGALSAHTSRVGYANDLKSWHPFDVEPAEPEPEIDNNGEENATDETTEPQTDPETGLPESELNVDLVGTMVVEDPSMSMGTVNVEGKSQLIRVGSVIQDKATVVSIVRRYVIVNEDGQQRIIKLWAEKKSKAKPKSGRKPSVASAAGKNRGKKAGRGRINKNYAEGVTKVGDTQYDIKREYIEDDLDDLSGLGMQARIVPNYKNGKYEGFKLVGVRPNSLYRAIGIRSGDVIKQINGKDINSPNKAIELFEQFKTSNNVELILERRGQVKTFEYALK